MSTMASTHTSDMRVISTRAHGAIDYILGIVLLFSPRIFGFTDAGGASVAVPMIVGAMLILLGMITKHELGIAKIVSMRTHLMLDYRRKRLNTSSSANTLVGFLVSDHLNAHK
jgi:hypothetical protein